MSEPLDEQYFQWLYQKVASVRLKNPTDTYWSLLRQLHKTEFVDLIANDDNRVEDGRDLRLEFLDETGEQGDYEWLQLGCSFLEMIIALSRRLTFEADNHDETDDWFWHLMRNLELDDYTDRYFTNHFTGEQVHDVLERVVQRRYNSDGSGGLFPLQDPVGDQRRVELWYQMSSYLLERI